MVDKNQLLMLAGKFLRSEKLESLSRAYDKTREIFNSSSNPKEAFTKANVSPEMFSMIKGYMNNPIAPFFLKAFGLNADEAKNIVNSLSNEFGAKSACSSNSDLDSLQKSLSELQKK